MRCVFFILAGLLLASCGKKTASSGSGGPTNPAPSGLIIPAGMSNLPPIRIAGYQYQEDLLTGLPPLIREDKAQQIVNFFKDVYPEMGTPRILIYVDPETVDADKITHHRLVIDKLDPYTTKKNQIKQIASEIRDSQIVPTTPDPAMVYDVGHLFARPFRAAGALIVSDKTAKQLTKGQPVGELIGLTNTPEAQVRREVLGGGADVVVEIEIFMRSIGIASISGQQTLSIPELTVTAISLRDGKIVGTASSSDVTKNISLERMGVMDVRQLTEATALALMNDMVLRKR
jgi:hypothetical protein